MCAAAAAACAPSAGGGCNGGACAATATQPTGAEAAAATSASCPTPAAITAIAAVAPVSSISRAPIYAASTPDSSSAFIAAGTSPAITSDTITAPEPSSRSGRPLPTGPIIPAFPRCHATAAGNLPACSIFHPAHVLRCAFWQQQQLHAAVPAAAEGAGGSCHRAACPERHCAECHPRQQHSARRVWTTRRHRSGANQHHV
mmetsp:Transcript_41562/g.124245  ORF Transcript_41562/g.124245 Transcript_41562/m.124245 type:complete len:201 (+) Transcript_41562:1445-2047(+)